MVDRVELAKEYIQELLQRRGDIIAAWVGGSVARGEATESSDIDLPIMVAADIEVTRAGFDTWRHGVYIEAGLVSQKVFADLGTVLNHPGWSTHMNDALILYDPTGFVTRLQAEVRAVFMQPQSVAKRVEFWMELTRDTHAHLQSALHAQAPLDICANLPFFVMGYLSIPLLRRGITPSSTRGTLQLGVVMPEMARRVFDLEGSIALDAGAVQALDALVMEAMPFADTDGSHLGRHFRDKAAWILRQGMYREALHVMSLVIAAAASHALHSEDAGLRAAVTDLVQRWLQRIGPCGPAILAAKALLADVLLHEAESLAAG